MVDANKGLRWKGEKMDLSKDKFFSVFEGEELSILRQVAKDFGIEGDLKDRGEKEVIELLWRKWEEGKEYKSCVSEGVECEIRDNSEDEGIREEKQDSLKIESPVVVETMDSGKTLFGEKTVSPYAKIVNPFRVGSKQFYAFECWRANPCKRGLMDRIKTYLEKNGRPSKNVNGLWYSMQMKVKGEGYSFILEDGILKLRPLGSVC